MKTPIEQLQDCLNIQCSDGNWNYDPYMHGMANGMILAMALLKNEEPKYLDAPKEWLKDKNDFGDLSKMSNMCAKSYSDMPPFTGFSDETHRTEE